MKSNVETKIKISIFLCIISLIYFSFFNLLYGGRLGCSLMAFFWPIVFYSFISVFVYSYIKIDSQSLLKRGLFFGIIMWIVDLPQVLMNVRQTLIMIDVVGIFPFIRALLYFIILGLIISFCYKKFLPEEFNLSLRRLQTSFIKVILGIISATLVYSLLMYFAEFLILYVSRVPVDISSYIGNLLNPLFYVNPLIYGLIFTLLYVHTIRKVDIPRIKKWVLFSIFIYFFTTPLIRLPGEITRYFFSTFPLMNKLLLIPHLLSIFILVYIFTKLLNGVSFSQVLPEAQLRKD